MTPQTATTDGEVIGGVVQVCIDGVMSVFQSRMREMLDEEGIERPAPHPDEWYPYDQFLRVLDAVERNTGENALSKIGEATPRFADWPTAPEGPEEALVYLTDLYEETHRNTGGSYTFEETDAGARIVSTTPYPATWESGLVKGTAEQFGAAYARVNIAEETDERKIYEVDW